MKLRDCYRIAHKNVKTTRKKNKLNIAIIAVALITMLVTNLFTDAMINFGEKYGLMGFSMRQIIVSEPESDRYDLFELINNRFNEDERVENIRRNCDMLISIDENYEFNSKVKEINTFFEGENNYTEYENALEYGEILIPEYIYVSKKAEQTFEEVKYIEGKDYIGKTIKLDLQKYELVIDYDLEGVPCSYYDTNGTKSYELKVVGTYDNLLTSTQCFYVSYDYAESIVNEIYTYPDDYNELKSKYPEDIEPKIDSVIVTIKDYKDSKELSSEISEYLGANDISVTSYGNCGTKGIDDGTLKTFEAVKTAGVTISCIILMWGIFAMVLTSLKEVKRRTGEYAVLKAIGYDNQSICRIMMLETLVISLKAIKITVVLGLLLMLGGNIYLKFFTNISMSRMTVYMSAQQICIFVIIAIGIPALTSLFTSKRIKSLSVIDALKSE